jgi:hypothetical protein
VLACLKKLNQMLFLASMIRFSYLSDRRILLRIASSDSDTRFVVRNNIPVQYSSFRKNTDKRPFRWRYCDDHFSKKTSALSSLDQCYWIILVVKVVQQSSLVEKGAPCLTSGAVTGSFKETHFDRSSSSEHNGLK